MQNVTEKKEFLIILVQDNIALIFEHLRNIAYILQWPKMEFKEFEPRFKSAKTRFKLSAGLNLETFDTILSGSNHIWATA